MQGSESRVSSVIFAMKSLLTYCRQVRRIPTIDPAEIRAPRGPRRDVVYLTKEELEQFFSVIPIGTRSGLRFRALCEVLLGTGARISEALSLDRNLVNFYAREVPIVGKGNKERVLFFTERSLVWLKQYLATREDAEPGVFVTSARRRLKRDDSLSRMFIRYRERAGLTKKVTPHIFCAATLMAQNGLPDGAHQRGPGSRSP